MDELLFLVRVRWHIQQAGGFGDIRSHVVYSYTDDNCLRETKDLDWRG